MTPAKRSTTFEHEGVTYDVYDWRFDGVQRKKVDLNSRTAEGRGFVPRDRTKPIRVYLFRGGINYGKSDPATLAQQFAVSETARRLW